MNSDRTVQGSSHDANPIQVQGQGQSHESQMTFVQGSGAQQQALWQEWDLTGSTNSNSAYTQHNASPYYQAQQCECQGFYRQKFADLEWKVATLQTALGEVRAERDR